MNKEKKIRKIKEKKEAKCEKERLEKEAKCEKERLEKEAKCEKERLEKERVEKKAKERKDVEVLVELEKKYDDVQSIEDLRDLYNFIHEYEEIYLVKIEFNRLRKRIENLYFREKYKRCECKFKETPNKKFVNELSLKDYLMRQNAKEKIVNKFIEIRDFSKVKLFLHSCIRCKTCLGYTHNGSNKTYDYYQTEFNDFNEAYRICKDSNQID